MNTKLLLALVIINCITSHENIALNIMKNQPSIYLHQCLQPLSSNIIISKDEAIKSIMQVVGNLPKGFYLTFDHEEKVKNKEFYVIHYYETVLDNKETGEGHSVTYEWFYVDKNNGDIYRLDVITGELILVYQINYISFKYFSTSASIILTS